MADKALMNDVAEFLQDVVGDLTGMHVLAAQYSVAPTDEKAVEALAKLPAGLIDRAQALAARVEKADSAEDETPKPKAPKAAAKK